MAYIREILSIVFSFSRLLSNQSLIFMDLSICDILHIRNQK